MSAQRHLDDFRFFLGLMDSLEETGPDNCAETYDEYFEEAQRAAWEYAVAMMAQAS